MWLAGFRCCTEAVQRRLWGTVLTAERMRGRKTPSSKLQPRPASLGVWNWVFRGVDAHSGFREIEAGNAAMICRGYAEFVWSCLLELLRQSSRPSERACWMNPRSNG